MPRKPTGNPTGRPKGTGPLGATVKRVTIHLPLALYDKLQTFSEGHTFTHGTPELSHALRKLLEHALGCPNKRQTVWNTNGQTRSDPQYSGDTIKLPRSETPDQEDTLQQPIIVPSLLREEPLQDTWQTESIPLDAHDQEPRDTDRSVPPSPAPAFDASTHVLGPLCKYGHVYEGTTQSLRTKRGHDCVRCIAQRQATQRAKRKKQVTS